MALVEDAIHLGFLPEDKVLTKHFEFVIEFFADSWDTQAGLGWLASSLDKIQVLVDVET